MGAILYDWTAIMQKAERGASVSELLAEYGMSPQTLYKKLAKFGLNVIAGKIMRERAQHIADNMAMMEAGRPAIAYEDSYETRTEILAEIGANVLARHRRAFAHTQNILAKLKTKIDYILDNPVEIEESLVEYFGAKAAKDPLGASGYAQQLSAALSAIQVPALTKSVANIAQAEKTLAESERKAYRLDDEQGEKTYEDFLREAHEKIINVQRARDLPVIESSAA